MPIVEYKNIKDKDGVSKPGYICEGGTLKSEDDHSMIGWVQANPKYWVPSGLKRLSKEEFAERCKKKIERWDEISEEEQKRIIEEDGENRWEEIYDRLHENWTRRHGE